MAKKVWIVRVRAPSGGIKKVSLYAYTESSVRKLIERDFGIGSIISGPVAVGSSRSRGFFESSEPAPRDSGPGSGKVIGAHALGAAGGFALGWKLGKWSRT